jgi:hypothetical protein
VSSYGERLVVLAALAFLAAVVAVAVIEQAESDRGVAVPEGAQAPGGGWYQALAATRATGDAEQTTCGLVLTGRSFGVTHPVLPCGAKLLLRFGGDTVLTEVIDNRLESSGRQFELTERLSRRIGLDGTQQVQWRFARPASG